MTGRSQPDDDPATGTGTGTTRSTAGAPLTDRDAAQLILVGAIAIAVIVVGLTVVLNSLLFTEAVSTASATDQLDESGEFDYESRKGTRSLLLRLNHLDRNVTAADLGDRAELNVVRYSRLLTESYATSQSATVNVTYDNGSSAFGDRVVQSGDGSLTFAPASPAKNWEPVPPGDHRRIGWFTLNVNVTATSTVPAYVTVTNATGHSINYTINRSTGPAGVNVTADPSYAPPSTANCASSRGRVLLDLLGGDAFGAGCSYDGAETLGGPYTVSIDNGTNLVGRYELAVNESVSPLAGDYDDCARPPAPHAPADQPCTAPIVWTANLTTQYQGTRVAFTNEYNVSVYTTDP